MFRQLWKYPFRGPKASIFMPICWHVKIGRKSEGRERGRKGEKGRREERGRMEERGSEGRVRDKGEGEGGRQKERGIEGRGREP